jgi:hypothetical protein
VVVDRRAHCGTGLSRGVGLSRGIGFKVCRKLAQRDMTVIPTARDPVAGRIRARRAAPGKCRGNQVFAAPNANSYACQIGIQRDEDTVPQSRSGLRRPGGHVVKPGRWPSRAMDETGVTDRLDREQAGS